MEKFRFAIMGAGNIALRFVKAVNLLEDACVCAVASKSAERAQAFAEANQIEKAYDSYEQMLLSEKPDCVYISATTDAHYELTMLCLEHRVPVLCEKAMFMNKKQAQTAFAKAKEYGVFVMEAMWSRFLPALKEAKKWLEEGLIGDVVFAENSIGFKAAPDPSNRFLNPALGGGAAYDITVYTYEIMTFMLGYDMEQVQLSSVIGETGVDLTDHVVLQYKDKIASLNTSIAASLQEDMVIYGTKGRIVVPHPHVTMDAYLYDLKGNLLTHFEDKKTKDGFTYEIQETMDCIRAGRIESSVVSHADTIDCATILEQLSVYGREV